MNVGVNLTFLRPAEVGGGSVYVEKLLGAMRQFGAAEIFIYGTRYAAERFRDFGFHAEAIVDPPYSQLRRLIGENWSISGAPGFADLDVLFSPSGIGAPLLPSPVPQVVTVHDLQQHHFPGYFSAPRLLGRLAFVPASLARAERVVAVSEFTKEDILRHYGWCTDAVRVVHEAADAAEIPSRDRAEDVQRALDITSPFFIYPAATGSHKNHLGLLEAFDAFCAQNSSVELVLCGRSTEMAGEVERRISELGLDERIHQLGVLKRSQLLGLMKAAHALVFPSQFEGFGLPLVEAMACETPIIASDRAAIPEVAGDAGLLVAPDDVGGWVDAMERVVADEVLRDKLIRRGLERVEYFSWERAARETLEVLREAAGLSSAFQ